MTFPICLQLVGKVHRLVVDGQLLSVVRDDEDADGARATAEGLLEAVPEATLVNHLETLLDLTGLGHGHETPVIADVNKAVLLEDGAKERVEHDRGGRVRDHAGLLVELLGEEVHTEVTVLARLRRGGDADHLAGAVLEDHKVADADVVAGDGKGGRLGGMHRRDMRVVSTAIVLVL